MEESINNADTPADGDSLPSVVRGNRTKRQRLQLPPLPVFAGGEIPVSSTSSAQFSGRITTARDEEEEEQDIANCLILLAMGRALETPIRKPESKMGIEEAETAVKLAAAAAATNGKTGCHVYKCKTCNKCFPSFQALGGHRVSHKKPKLSISSSEKVPTVNSTGAVEEPTASAAASGGKGKRRIHVCSICGVKFTSGQALGGHMRRHRPASHQEPVKKEKSGLSVDLNLPAPSDEDQRSFAAFPKSSSDSTATIPAVFSFAAKTPLLLLPPALVDCHY